MVFACVDKYIFPHEKHGKIVLVRSSFVNFDHRRRSRNRKISDLFPMPNIFAQRRKNHIGTHRHTISTPADKDWTWKSNWMRRKRISMHNNEFAFLPCLFVCFVHFFWLPRRQLPLPLENNSTCTSSACLWFKCFGQTKWSTHTCARVYECVDADTKSDAITTSEWTNRQYSLQRWLLKKCSLNHLSNDARELRQAAQKHYKLCFCQKIRQNFLVASKRKSNEFHFVTENV